MSKGNEYTRRRDYVANLNGALSAVPDFEGIVYVHTSTDKEYVKIWNTLGWVIYLDISQMDLYEVFTTIAQAVIGQVPKNALGYNENKLKEDREIMRSLVPLVRQELARQVEAVKE